MSSKIKLFLSLLPVFVMVDFVQASEINPTDNISMSQVVNLVKLQNLEIKVASENIKSKKALLKQAGVLPNPEIELESENIFGNGGNTGLKNAETTAKTGFLIELGGKRYFRVKAAQKRKEISELEYLNVLINKIISSSKIGTEILRQQELLILDKERFKINQLFSKEIEARVQKGRLSVVEQKRANMLVFQSNLKIKQRRLMLNSTKNQLSASWGYSEAQFDLLEGDLSNFDSVTPLNILVNRLSENIALKLKRAEVELAKEEIKFQKSLGTQDLFIGGGIKHENSSNDKSFILSTSIPIAIFDQNSAAIESSNSNLKQKELAMKNTFIQVQNKLKTLYLEIQMLKIEIDSLRQEIIPESREIFNTLQEGYLKGKFSYLEVLESQNTLFEFKENYIDTLAQYHCLMLETKLLTGLSFERSR
ncbi:MAG: TolC family protein [bacterium]|nr:TolC family protein [bacterium]